MSGPIFATNGGHHETLGWDQSPSFFLAREGEAGLTGSDSG